MFESYDPREGRILSLLDETGRLAPLPPGMPRLTDEQALAAYKTMVLSRQVDEWAVSLNRQGRMPTYALNKGQEANSVGALMAVRPDDWFVPAFRELGGMLVRGISLKQYFLYWYGNEWANHMPPDTFHMMPISVPVGSQMLHAVGLAWAERYKGNDRIAITFMGEGASSEGEFHEACNLAGWGVVQFEVSGWGGLANLQYDLFPGRICGCTHSALFPSAFFRRNQQANVGTTSTVWRVTNQVGIRPVNPSSAIAVNV